VKGRPAKDRAAGEISAQFRAIACETSAQRWSNSAIAFSSVRPLARTKPNGPNHHRPMQTRAATQAATLPPVPSSTASARRHRFGSRAGLLQQHWTRRACPCRRHPDSSVRRAKRTITKSQSFGPLSNGTDNTTRTVVRPGYTHQPTAAEAC